MAWTSPRTWVAGEVVTAALLNTHVRDNLKAIGDAWTAYTPTWKSGAGGTDISIGSGTKAGLYLQAGKLVHFQILIVRAADTNLGTTGYAFGLPVTSSTRRICGGAWVIDSSASANLPHQWAGVNTSEIVVHAYDGRRIDNSGFNVGPTAWGTSDEIFITGTYQAA